MPLGRLDIAFHRDDLAAPPRRRRPRHRNRLRVDGATVVIVDDVLFTGRTVRGAAIDALFEYGRPARVQLAVLIDRGHRELPIRPDYVGKNLPTSLARAVNVSLAEARRRRPGRRSARGRGRCDERHLLSIEDLERDEDRAHPRDRGEVRRGRDRADQEGALAPRATVINLFYEASTRTRSSFELAAKRLSADVLNVARAARASRRGSRCTTPSRRCLPTSPTAIVMRSAAGGAPAWSRARPRPASSTPATASTSTRRRRCSTATRSRSGSARWTAEGSGSSATSLHSRVARSGIQAFTCSARRSPSPARRRSSRTSSTRSA